ncbi:hypothetical protein [Candidatus Poriferisocius sp.]|uniref:hypothetical protein n=1 Tax=Candidatus Poriferisocius sp. TaxID=3101276 RepID=UPI003B520A33
MKTREMNIPFDGFYQSISDSAIDDIAYGFLDTEEQGEPNWDLVNHCCHGFNWGAAQEAWCEAYLYNLKMFIEHECPTPVHQAEGWDESFRFAGIDSPQFYNFTTDRLFANVAWPVVRRIYSNTKAESLTGCAKEMFTSRSGFCSFYDPDWTEWDKLKEWDHNQLGCLFRAFLYDHGWDMQEALSDLYDASYELGIEDAVLDGATSEVTRCIKIADYLRERQYRVA